MGYKFGNKSMSRLNTCHPDLIEIMLEAIMYSDIDFGISEGHRTVERQKELYDQGLSQIDGITKKGMHNYQPSMAVDIFVAGTDNAYDKDSLIYIAGVVRTIANMLYFEKMVDHRIRWGGNWDNDNIIIKDQTFQDLCHFELI